MRMIKTSLIFFGFILSSTLCFAQSQSNIVISDPIARATQQAMPVSGAFMEIENIGNEDDILIGARAEFAKKTEIHETKMIDEIMKMRELKQGLPIPAGKKIGLKPGGYHVMFIGLKSPLIKGETYPITLIFEKAGEIQIEVKANDMKKKMMH